MAPSTCPAKIFPCSKALLGLGLVSQKVDFKNLRLTLNKIFSSCMVYETYILVFDMNVMEHL